MIAVTRDGTIYIHERQVDMEGLKDIITPMMIENPQRESVILADRASQTGALVHVIDACNLSGAHKVSIAAITE